MQRLQKVIGESGYTSRRKAEELIKAGKVSVNGNIVTELGTKVSIKDMIEIEGNRLETSKKEYYLLNKPRSIISSSKDEMGRKTVVDLIETDSRIFPIGRLDYDTTGLILLTNDGELTNILSHPKTKVLKTYLAKLDRFLEMEDYFAIKNGLEIDGRKVEVEHLKIKKKDKTKGTCFVEITIHEGRNHIVKKVFEKLKYDVVKLTRTNYAFLNLGTLQSGEYRTLTKDEVRRLYELKR